jgi:hypothetical protein
LVGAVVDSRRVGVPRIARYLVGQHHNNVAEN